MREISSYPLDNVEEFIALHQGTGVARMSKNFRFHTGYIICVVFLTSSIPFGAKVGVSSIENNHHHKEEVYALTQLQPGFATRHSLLFPRGMTQAYFYI